MSLSYNRRAEEVLDRRANVTRQIPRDTEWDTEIESLLGGCDEILAWFVDGTNEKGGTCIAMKAIQVHLGHQRQEI